jgi:DNA-binding XRE family transcriptional regulator
MGSVQDGTVYLSLDADAVFDEENTEAHWTGNCQFSDGSPPEDGPAFVDAGEAVTWWRQRGATRICIRLDFEETLWAGEGAFLSGSESIATFDFADPRGRPEGARETLAGMRRTFAERESSQHAARACEEGRRLTRRRESMDLSIDELANRVGVSSEWLPNVEAGKTTYEVTFPQWITLVWATRKGWPDEIRSAKTGASAWVARRGCFLREAELHVNERLGLYD